MKKEDGALFFFQGRNVDEDLTQDSVSDPLINDAAPDASTENATVDAPLDTTSEVTTTESADPGQAAAPTAAAMVALREHLASKQFDTSGYDTDEAALDALLKQAQDAKVYQQHVAYYQHQLQQYQQPQPQVQAQPPVEEKPYWEPLPEFDPAWTQLLERDPASGRLLVKEQFRGHVSPDIAQKAEAFIKAKEDRQMQLLRDPAAAIRPGFKKDFEEVNSKIARLEQQLVQREAQAQAEHFINAYDAVLFNHDDQGRRMRDPTSGEYSLSPFGQAFKVNLVYAMQTFGFSEQQATQYALNQANAYVAQLPQQQQAAPTNETRKGEFAKALRTPQRGGTEAADHGPNAIAQNRQLSFREKLVREAKANGHEVPA